MIRTIFLAILCSCAIALGQNANLDQIDYNKVKVNLADMAEFQDARNSLWLALKNGDVDKVDVALAFLSHEMIPESALDSLELLQINLLLERYDQAIPQFANLLMKAGKKVRYSFDDDSLFAYLRNETRIGAYYRNRPGDRDRVERLMRTESYLQKAMQADVKQEYKDLAYILYRLQSWYDIFDKEKWIYISNVFTPASKDSLANLIDKRSEFWIDYHNEMDTLGVDLLLEKMRVFRENYPESEYSDWLKQTSRKIAESQKSYKKFRNYYEEKLYTGGIGLEAFLLGVSLSFTEGEFLLGVPVQISRFIVTPSMFLGGEFSDAFFITAGIDVYENKWIKIQPFAGGYDLFTAGLQVDYRFWMSKTPGPEFHDATYLTLKLRYMGIYNAPEAKKEWHNRIYLGLGLHFW